MTRSVDIRFVIVRNGADFCELYALDSQAPSLSMDDSASVQTTLSGVFARDDRINWLSDEIRPEIIIDGVRSPLGIYAATTATESEDGTTKYVQIEACDRCWRVQDCCTEKTIHFDAGLNYLDPVKELLTLAGITVVNETPTTAVLAEAREDWSIGTNYLEIINQLLDEINYNPLWFNAQGAAVLEPATVPKAENIEHTLDAGNVKNLLLPSFDRSTDIYSAPNVFICICSNPDKDNPMVATSENTNPQSPLSINRRGRRIAQVISVDNIADQDALQAYADRIRNQSMIGGETVRVQTALFPGYGVSDVTALNYGDFSGICIERKWSMELKTGGAMTHELEKVVLNLG